MTYPTEITLPFGDGQYRLWLPLPVLGEFERKHGSLFAFEWTLRQGIGLDDKGNAVLVGESEALGAACRDMVRLGLTGGNKGTVDGEPVDVGPRRAEELTELYTFPARPLGETAALAWRIASAAIYGNKLAEEECSTPAEPAKTETTDE